MAKQNYVILMTDINDFEYLTDINGDTYLMDINVGSYNIFYKFI